MGAFKLWPLPGTSIYLWTFCHEHPIHQTLSRQSWFYSLLPGLLARAIPYAWNVFLSLQETHQKGPKMPSFIPPRLTQNK